MFLLNLAPLTNWKPSWFDFWRSLGKFVAVAGHSGQEQVQVSRSTGMITAKVDYSVQKQSGGNQFVAEVDFGQGEKSQLVLSFRKTDGLLNWDVIQAFGWAGYYTKHYVAFLGYQGQTVDIKEKVGVNQYAAVSTSQQYM